MKRHTYRAVIAYDGGAFAGFAVVPGERTVWSTVRAALIRAVPGLGKMAAAGRTDRGVSAIGQVISFIGIERVAPAVITRALDEAAPGELAALDVREVSNSFHAQFSACARRYAYFLPDRGDYDVAALDRMVSALVGRRDFTAFARNTPPGKDTHKRLWDARVRAVASADGPLVRFDFVGESFLRKQVRVMVSTALAEAARGHGDDALVAIAEGRDRRTTPHPAPAEGLVLVSVSYEALRGRPGELAWHQRWWSSAT